MNYTDILDALREVTSQERIDFLPLALDSRPLSKYQPIVKYLLDLKNGAKPETAAEDLFGALCRDVLKFQPTRQVSSGEGWVDFMLPEPKGEPLPLELKPLFQRDGPDALWRSDANPKHHDVQVKKYLRDHEYLILTDLRTTWFFNARDYFFDNKPFAELPFVDFFARCRESASVLDTLRRIEDTAEKPELEHEFFEDLKIWYAEFDKVKWEQPDLAAESIILLINKLIFARTIEDFGLVQYRFTQDEYARFIKLWEPKGAHRVVPKFLDAFEEFFDEYYDTEIFSERIWGRLNKDPENLKRFSEKLNFVLGVGTWEETFSRGIVHYNYRRIDEDIFGKSYEMFLADNRKDEGIYYTPAGITGPMADSLVNSLVGKLVDDICAAVDSQNCDFAKAEKFMAQLAEVRVADTACGSGGFLIKVLRAFWQQYQRVDQACAWVQKILKPENGEMYLAEMPPNVEAALGFRRRQNLENRRVLIAQILLRHIFGVDKDPGALEVAKTNIWKEAVKLSPADYNYRLLKTDVVKILPNLELNFHSADSLVDVEMGKQVEWLTEYHQTELKKLAELRARYTENPMRHEPLDEALKLRANVCADFIEHFQGENLPCEPAAFALHFWPCWFKPDGKPVKTPGFDGVIGNPPWENVKPVAKEFAKVGKYSDDRAGFDKWFGEKLKKDKDFAARWAEHQEWYEEYKEFLGRRFQKQGTGDWNLWKLFIERDLNLVRHGGQFSLLVPSGFQTDEGCAELRKWLCTGNTMTELTSFENKGYTVVEAGKEKHKKIFPDVHPQFKFGFFKVTKGIKANDRGAFEARFYLHDPKDALTPAINFKIDMIEQFSPENFAIMEFRSESDYELCAKIRSKNPILKDLGHVFRREFHMTEDSRFFHKTEGKKPAEGQLLLYEGKMIFQFDDHFAPASYYVVEKEAREELLRKEIFRLSQIVRDSDVKTIEDEKVPAKKEDLSEVLRKVFKRKKFKLQFECERLAYRAVASSTNERTLIAALIRPNVCMAHSIYYLNPYGYELSKNGEVNQRFCDALELRTILACFNSLVWNFYARSKVSANLNISSIEELPTAKVSSLQKKKLADSVDKLLKDPHDVKERASLEVFIARELYGLSPDDWKHLTGTFTFGGGETKEELDEIIRQSLALWS